MSVYALHSGTRDPRRNRFYLSLAIYHPSLRTGFNESSLTASIRDGSANRWAFIAAPHSQNFSTRSMSFHPGHRYASFEQPRFRQQC